MPGAYTVTLVVTNLFGTNSATQMDYIVVNTTPLANFEVNTIANGVVGFNNTTINASAYQWTFGDGSPFSTDVNPTHTYTQSGTYTVSLSAINDCGVSVYQTTVTVDVVGVNDVDWVQKFRLFPNPNHGAFVLEMEGASSDELRFDLYNTTGQLIRSDIANFSTGKLNRRFDYGALPSGVYAFRISDSATSFVVRIVVD